MLQRQIKIISLQKKFMSVRRFFIYVLLVLLPLQSMATESAHIYIELSTAPNVAIAEHSSHHDHDMRQMPIHEGHQERDASEPFSTYGDTGANHSECDGGPACTIVAIAVSLRTQNFPIDDRTDNPYSSVNLNYVSHIPGGLLRPPRILA